MASKTGAPLRFQGLCDYAITHNRKEEINLDNQTVGSRGESHVCAILEGIARECGGAVLRNLYIPTGGGHTAEIDAVLVTRKGAFVVEIKSWQGHVRGNSRYNEWSVRPWRKLKAKPEKRYSPIKQNAKHVEIVSKLTRVSPSAFTSLIVFTSSAELKKVPPNEANLIITREDGLRSAVKTRLRGRRERFTANELEALCAALSKAQGASSVRRRTHVSQAKQAERRRLEAREKRRKADRKRRARKKAQTQARTQSKSQSQSKAKARRSALMLGLIWAGLGCLLLVR